MTSTCTGRCAPRLAASSLALALTLVAAPGAAGEPEPSGAMRWDPSWTPGQPAELVVTGVAASASLAIFLWAPPPQHPNVTGGFAFDDGVRDAIGIRAHGPWMFTERLAEAVFVTEIVLSAGVDGIIVPLAAGKPKIAWDLSVMNAEAFALDTVIVLSLLQSVARARPTYADCQRDPDSHPNCTEPGRYLSFPSGHASEPFTAAGLSCAHHQYVAIYGNPVLDALACVRDLSLASLEGMLRIIGERHYASDVMVGAAIGLGLGYGIPTIFHYHVAPRAPGVEVTPLAGVGTYGLSAVGRF